MLRFCFICFGVLLLGENALANSSIQLQGKWTKQAEFIWVKRFLRMRRYSITYKKGPHHIQLKLLTPSWVQVSQNGLSQKCQLPSGSPLFKARMCLACLDLLLERIRHQNNQRKTPLEQTTQNTTTNIHSSHTKKKKYQKRQRPVQAHNRTIRSIRTQKKKERRQRQNQKIRYSRSQVRSRVPYLSNTNHLNPPKRRTQRASDLHSNPAHVKKVQERKISALKQSTSQPKASKRSPVPQKRRGIANKRTQHLKVRAKPAQIEHRFSNTSTARFKKRTVPSHTKRPSKARSKEPQQSLDKRVTFHLGLGGGFSWSNLGRVLGGGELFVGIGLWRFALYVDLELHGFFLNASKRPLLLVRPRFWLGFDLPLGSVNRWIQLAPLLGVPTEVFLYDKGSAGAPSFSTEVVPGLGLGFQFDIRFSLHWSLLLRTTLSCFPTGSWVSSTDRQWRPILQWNGMLGVHVQF